MNYEKQVQQLWDDIDITNLLKATGGKPFNFIDGAPFCSGSLHLGHLAVGSYKSVVCNAMKMLGYDSSFILGYDTHGIPTETSVVRDHKLSVADIEEMGIAKFNKLCDDMITNVSNSWTPLFKKFGRIADFKNVYMTRDKNFMESVMWIFKRLWDKGFVYSGNKVMPYSYALQTPLSNFEAGQNYRDVTVKSVFVRFKLKKSVSLVYDSYFIVWTTTPWTLPCNLALCVNPTAIYCMVLIPDTYDCYILAESSIGLVFGKKNVSKYTIIKKFTGSDLVGIQYEPLYPKTFNSTTPKHFTVLSDNYVSDDGKSTAIVHQAPGFGEDDFRVCSANGLVDNVTISDYCPIDKNCKYTQGEYDGQFVLDCSDQVREQLATAGAIVKTLVYSHSYPHCYRTDQPLIYRTVESFFINVQMLKERMIELNKTMVWHPEEIGTKRFGNWLESAKDWAVSRYRYYGTPIPVWKSDDGDCLCIGSIDELAELAGIDRSEITNLHPEYLNDIVLTKDGKEYRRVSDIFDCWFESGSAPFAQLHYPFNEESVVDIDSREYLADFICEGLDQTRGWFYTLLVISTAIADKAPAKNIVCTGLVLDENSQKLSKKLGNYTDPTELIEQYGADIIRTYLVKSPLMKAQPLSFSEKSLKQLKARMSPYHNSAKFLNTYIEIYTADNGERGWGDSYKNQYSNRMDSWLLDRITNLYNENCQKMLEFNMASAAENLIEALDDITNWYLRLNRNRLKGVHGNTAQRHSLNVLYTCLMCYTQLWAPFMPFIAEHIFGDLKKYHYNPAIRESKSVLLTSFYFGSRTIDRENMQIMTDLQRICTMTRAIRSSSSTHTSQKVPFKKLCVGHADKDYLKKLVTAMNFIDDELNTKEIDHKKLEQNITYTLKFNHRELGRDFKKNIKTEIDKYNSYDQSFLKSLYNSDPSATSKVPYPNKYFSIDAVPDNVTNDNIRIDNDLMVEADMVYDLDINYSHQLREFQSKYQQTRKELVLIASDIVEMTLDTKSVQIINEHYRVDVVMDLHERFCNNTILMVGTPEQFVCKWNMNPGDLIVRFDVKKKE